MRGAGWTGVAAGLAGLAGCALQLQMVDLWRAEWVGCVALASAVIGAAAWRGQRPVLWAIAALLLGFALTHQRAAWRVADGLDASLEGQDLLLTGTVASLPRETPDGVRFVFAVEAATQRGAAVRVPRRVSLGWYRGIDDGALLGGPAEHVVAGQRWQLPVRLARPHGFMNPHGFDFELWLFEQGIRASGSVRSRPGAVALKLDEHAGHAVQRWRQQWREAIQARVSDSAAAGVLAALAIGDQASIERADWELFRATGIAHLMSISGLHVTMFAWLAGGLVAWLWRRHPRAPLLMPAVQAGRWGGLLAATGYALLAGWGVPAQRTVWMLAVVVLLRQRALHWPPTAVLLAAAVVVAAIDPWALLQAGFWLSFVAVGLLIVSDASRAPSDPAQSRSARVWVAVKAALRTQAVAAVGLAPLSMLFFQQISLIGFVANLVAVPLVTLVITPLALLGLLLAPLWTVAAALVQGLAAVLQPLAEMPFAQWTAAAAPPWGVACGLLGALLAVLPLPLRLRLCALPLLLPLLAPPVQRPAEGQFELIAADVGQGSAVLLRTRTHLLVYDAGPSYSREADAGVRVLLPMLRARGERQIDLLMLSHRDSDHVGGAAAMLRALPVRAISSSLEAGHPLRQAGPPHTPCEAGRRWAWDGVAFELLHPPASDLGRRTLKPNAISCVLRVQAASGASVLLAGDIEAAQEAALVARTGAALASRVLLVPHHGSRTSSTAALLDAVAPRVALVQAAHRSRFGHPAPEVLARYEARGIALARSDRCGAWAWRSVGGASCERSAAARYWQHPDRQEAPQP
jgi:competence protein ComEC